MNSQCKSIWLEPEKKHKPKIFKFSVGEGACPACGKETILRKGRYGKFYGCSTFPACRGSRNYD